MDLFHSSWNVRFIMVGLGFLAVVALGVYIMLGLRFRSSQQEELTAATPERRTQPTEESYLAEARHRMVADQLRNRDIDDPRVLAVMGRIARHHFVSKEFLQHAYDDNPLPIGCNQTISQPYIVALMTQLAALTPQSRVLEIGTGSGYQTAVLAELSKEVYSVEILQPLADSARELLATLGYKNVSIRHGNGYEGWMEHAPYDAILVTAAPEEVPKMLEEQLAIGGRMVIPIGHGFQELMLLKKRPDGTIHRESVIGVLFVPMIGNLR